jgi:hypothetical protein
MLSRNITLLCNTAEQARPVCADISLLFAAQASHAQLPSVAEGLNQRRVYLFYFLHADSALNWFPNICIC